MTGNSTLVSREVAVYVGNWTWNEAYRTCMGRGMSLLGVLDDADHSAARMLQSKYEAFQRYQQIP